MLHHLALFTPILYTIFGEILPSRSRKMRLKLKPLLFLAALIGLTLLYGFRHRDSSGENMARDAHDSVQGGSIKVDSPLVAIPKENIQGEDIRMQLLQEQLKKHLPRDGEGGGRDVVLPAQETAEKEDPNAAGKKRFPQPISLKPRPNAPKPGPGEGRVESPQQPAGVPGRPQGQREAPLPPPHPQGQGQSQMKGGAPQQQPPPQSDLLAKQEEINRARLEAARKKMEEERKLREQSQHAVHGEVNRQEVEADLAGGSQSLPDDTVINLSVVCCGDRTNETLVMLKTATILAKQRLQFHIFAEDNLQPGIAQRLNAWPAAYRSKIDFNLHPISFPPGEDPEKWKKVFKMCATQRLFLPDLLPHVDSLLYVDTDILFIRPIDEIYSFFKQFNSTHMAAMTPEHEVRNIGWYNRFARHPYYGETGVNSGVMLMNLTRMRKFGWTQRIVPIYHEYKLKITWGDQDLINILFHDHPEGLFSYPCEWNYRPDHCMYSNNCHRTGEHGIAVIHGNRGVYHNEKQLAFRAIYESFRDYEFGADINQGLIEPLKNRLTQENLEKNYCAKAVLTPVTSTLRKYADRVAPVR